MENNLNKKMKLIRNISGNNSELTAAILNKTTKRTLGPYKAICKVALSYLLIIFACYLLNIALSALAPNAIETVVSSHTASISVNTISSSTLAFYYCKGLINLIIKLVILAFILTAAAMPGQQSEPIKGVQHA
jgi:hypothetical protein